jgi:hypothetical protein
MTAIETIGFSIFVMIVIGTAVALAVVTGSIRQEEARLTFGGAAPTRTAKLTRRMLGAYCDPACGLAYTWTDESRPERDRAGQPV